MKIKALIAFIIITAGIIVAGIGVASAAGLIGGAR